MFFTIVGVGVFCYGVVHSILACIFDCDLRLAFYEKFGKSIRRMAGQVVFITGASSGIGEHTAYAFAKHGVKLALAARRIDELERVKKNCIEASNGKLNENDVLVVQLDITDTQSHKLAFEKAVKHFGAVDVLFNNAGRSQRAFWEDIDLDVDREMFNLNVFGVVNLTRVAISHFKKRGRGGQIAVTSSIAGVLGVPFSGTYTGSKHAIHGYFNALRSEKSGKGISVSLLCPGPTFTNFLQESFTDKKGQKYGVSTNPSDRRMTGERCGELCAVAITNKISEGWMGMFPIIPMTYIARYFPLLFEFAVKVVGPEKVFKLRDSKENVVLTEKKD